MSKMRTCLHSQSSMDSEGAYKLLFDTIVSVYFQVETANYKVVPFILYSRCVVSSFVASELTFMFSLTCRIVVQCVAANPSTKMPFIEGNLIKSFFEENYHLDLVEALSISLKSARSVYINKFMNQHSILHSNILLMVNSISREHCRRNLPFYYS